MSKRTEPMNTVDFKKARLISQFDSLMQTWSEDTAVSRLFRRLQTTLDIAELIAIFMEELETLVAFDHYRYAVDTPDIVVETGKRARHHCDYRLRLDDQLLGTLVISRSKRFVDEELKVIETLMATLVFPLRNALTFQQMAHAAMTDALTGLGNKRALDSQLRREADMAMRRSESLSVIVADIDHFKRVNDGLGHQAGDDILREVAKTMRNVMRRSDLCFRYGGEEFVIVLSKADATEARRVAERLRHAVATTEFKSGGARIPVTISCGTATMNSDERLDSFFQRADEALYEAKRAGRNRVVSASDVRKSADAPVAPGRQAS